MERVRSEAIPAILERLAKKEDTNNPERAAKIRKQISFIKTDWVDAKPIRSAKEYAELKSPDGVKVNRIGFDDDAPKNNRLERFPFGLHTSEPDAPARKDGTALAGASGSHAMQS